MRIAEDEAAGLLDDAVDHRQSEPGALAHLLGGEEGLEYLLQRLRRDAGAGILDLDQHIVAGLELAIAEAGAFGRGQVARPHRQVAAVRHGVARVDGEIDDHLLELADVCPHRPQIAPVLDLQRHLVADQPRQQHAQIGQHVGQVQHFGPQRLAARERQQLPHQRGGAVGVLLDVHDVGKGWVRRPVVGQKQVRRHDDGGQHIVEIVRDAAGELSHRLHLLALRHLRLERLLLRRLDRIDDRGLLAHPRCRR